MGHGENLRMLTPTFAKVVVLDSGFCVLKGNAEPKKRGLYAAAGLIKKYRYWLRFRGDKIQRTFG
jgi:hypothetical protein